eukprot:CAMPEP_0172452068 /NCGR_PEP_ID=MMETSP1065-20121228/9832_1 /TAXON_ID=265537 /ORGANISM="Amphiprora paludosa, Strain CCMP125" /LENGTH=464 /DNA_ID=CAMNT_0013204063 /DNA_START=55 /DNA_END=1449 /DNA_ORIENTATION=-
MPPTPSPTIHPSASPSTSPTQLTWALATNDGNALHGDASPSDDFIPLGGGLFGTKVAIADIENTAIGNATNRTTLLVIGYGGTQRYRAAFGGIGSITLGVSFYLCDGSTCDPGSLAFGDANQLFALSENGAVLAVENSIGIVDFFELQNMDLRAESGCCQTALPTTNAFASGKTVLKMALNHDGTVLTRLTDVGIMRTGFLFGLGGLPFEAVWLPPLPLPQFCVPFEPCPDAFPGETMKSMGANDGFVAVGSNVLVPPSLLQSSCNTLARACEFPFNGYIVRVLDGNLNQIGNTIEMGTNRSLFSTDGLAINADGTVLAVSHAVHPRRDYNELWFSHVHEVNVYQLDQNTSTWMPMGNGTLQGLSQDDNFGISLAMNQQGTLLSVGARNDNTASDKGGRVATFEWDGDLHEWLPFGELFGPTNSLFGSSLALLPSGNQMVVGAPESDIKGENSGEIFLYSIVGV